MSSKEQSICQKVSLMIKGCSYTAKAIRNVHQKLARRSMRETILMSAQDKWSSLRMFPSVLGSTSTKNELSLTADSQSDPPWIEASLDLQSLQRRAQNTQTSQAALTTPGTSPAPFLPKTGPTTARQAQILVSPRPSLIAGAPTLTCLRSPVRPPSTAAISSLHQSPTILLPIIQH